MLNKVILPGILIQALIACGRDTASVNSKPNHSTAKTAEKNNGEPKRLNIAKGSTNVIEYFNLDIGESKRFVVEASKGKDITIGNGGDIKIAMITQGKMRDESNDSSSYNGVTTAGGDFIFEVTNTASQKIQSSVNVIIVDSVH